MREFEEQFQGVRKLMTELVREKREVFGRVEGEERGWKGKGWKDDFEGTLLGGSTTTERYIHNTREIIVPWLSTSPVTSFSHILH